MCGFLPKAGELHELNGDVIDRFVFQYFIMTCVPFSPRVSQSMRNSSILDAFERPQLLFLSRSASPQVAGRALTTHTQRPQLLSLEFCIRHPTPSTFSFKRCLEQSRKIHLPVPQFGPGLSPGQRAAEVLRSPLSGALHVCGWGLLLAALLGRGSVELITCRAEEFFLHTGELLGRHAALLHLVSLLLS